MKRTRTVVLGIAGTALLLTVGFAASPANAHGHSNKHGFGSDQPRVVADHLNNPRQLAVDGWGALYVAQAGSGGTACTGTGEDEQCTGNTASITKYRKPWKDGAKSRTVIGGLPSSAGPGGEFAIGANGVGVGDRVFGVVSGAPDVGTPNGDTVNTLFAVKHGRAKIVADLAAYEEANDPDGQGNESDPYSVLVQKKRVLVADAAGNDILSVTGWNKISTFHVFPNVTTGACAGQENDAGTTGCDFVPTALAAGPHGSIFVTGLASETPGEGQVVQLSRHGKVLRTWSGFTAPVGVAVNRDGSFYVSELLFNLNEESPDPPNTGQVTKVDRWGNHTSRVVPLPAGLVIIGHQLYVSAYSVAPAAGLFGNPDWNGQIWRMNL